MEKVNVMHKDDWSELQIERFWNWMTISGKVYFTEMVGLGIKNYLKKKINLDSKKMLDFGCGNGHFLSLFENENVELYGLDFAADSIIKAKEKNITNKNIQELTSIRNLPSKFADDSFDIITFIETIEHLNTNYLQNTILEINRLLKPGGFLFITTPNDENLLENYTYCPFCNSSYHRMQHMNSFTSEKLNKTMYDLGLLTHYTESLDFEMFQSPISYKLKRIFKNSINLFSNKYSLKKPHLVGIYKKTTTVTSS